MGQSIVVNEKPSANRGIVRFETNRLLTGMGHERYLAGDEVWGERPPDELARRLLRLDNVAGVHVHGNMITVDLSKGYGSEGIVEVIEDLYRFYPDPDPTAGESEPTVESEPSAEEPVSEAPAPEAPAPEEAPATEEPAPVEEAAAADDGDTDAAEPEGS